MAPRILRRDSSSIVRHSIKRTKEKERSMNFSRAVHAIFKGREAKIKVTSGLATFISFHVYILLTCTSGTQPWLTTDWKFISSLPPFYSSAFRFLFFLSLSLFLSFFLPPLLSSPRVRVGIGCLTRIREIDRIGGTARLCLQHSKQGEETIQIAASSGSEYLLGPLRKNGRGMGEREGNTLVSRVNSSLHLSRSIRVDREIKRRKGRKGGRARGCWGPGCGGREEGRRSEEVERSAFMPSGSKFAPSRRGSGRFLLHLALNLRI